MKGKFLKHIIFITVLCFLFSSYLYSNAIPEERVVAEWEPALGVMIRWPLGIPADLVIALSENEIIFVLVDDINAQNNAISVFSSWGVNMDNIDFVLTDTHSHWTRDYGPQFLISQDSFQVINQYFQGYPTERGCIVCNEGMERYDCNGVKFCNDEPIYEGYDCIVDDGTCEDITGDGQINDWLGDGKCDNGQWGLNFRCDEYGWDCGDCGDAIIDPEGYCDDKVFIPIREPIWYNPERIIDGKNATGYLKDFSHDAGTNIDFALHMGWEILDLPLYFTGGNFMNDGYNMGFATMLMVNENRMWIPEFLDIVELFLSISDFHIIDNLNIYGIQHIDTSAKMMDPETILIKQVDEGHPEYHCFEELADFFSKLNTYYGRSFEVHRIYSPGNTAYTNSLILNDRIYVPLFGVPEDELAINTYREIMPGYEVLGFYYDFWYGHDALHCRTIGIFDPRMMHISHRKIKDGVSPNTPIPMEAIITDYSGTGIAEESIMIKWRYEGDSDWNTEPMSQGIDAGLFYGEIPSLIHNTIINYFIIASNENGKEFTHPGAGWHVFSVPDETVPEAPTGLHAEALSSSSIDLDWTINSYNEEGFRLERKLSLFGSWDIIADLESGTSSYIDTDLNSNTMYSYRIKAYSSAGESDWSNEASARTYPFHQSVIVYRFFNNIRGGHLYTISEHERDTIMQIPEWNYEGPIFQVFDHSAPNTTITYRFFNTLTGIHLYTISEHERDAIVDLPEWNYEGPIFYVQNEQMDNSVPVFRFFNHIRGGHLYTISIHERDAVMELPDWSYEGIPFYVMPLE